VGAVYVDLFSPKVDEMVRNNSRQVNIVPVLVIDATPMGAQLLATAIARDHKFTVTRSIANMQDALPAIEREDHQIALVSTNLENDSVLGLQLIRRMRQVRPEVRTIALIDFPKRELIIEVFRAGARGILSRTDAASQLGRAINSVNKGEIWASAEQLAIVLDSLADLPTERLTDVKGNALLSKREAEIVSCVSEGLTNREIAARLKISENTVKNYLFHTFNKLGVSNRLELVLYNRAVRYGAQNAVGNASETDWLKQMSERGFGTAHVWLARRYWQGTEGVSKDPIASYTHLLLAEEFCKKLSDEILSLRNEIAGSFGVADFGEAQRRASEWSKRHPRFILGKEGRHAVAKIAS
jgi:DNA-binding NarL/FixJ family response regulator